MNIMCGCGGSKFASPAEAYRPTDQNASEQEEQEIFLMPHQTVAAKMNPFHANPNHYDFCTVIGRGNNDSAVIWLSKHVPSGTTVAVKRVNLESPSIDFAQLQHEIFVHRWVCQENILPYLCSFVMGNEILCVTPLMGFGSCHDLIHAHFTEGLPEAAIALILRDVLKALAYLHLHGIIHRAVRGSHILVMASGQVCLTGLRYSCSMTTEGTRARVVHKFPDSFVRCLNWASPELLEQNLAGYDIKSDIYAIGVTACELANGIVPFSDMPLTQMLIEKIDGIMPRLLDSVTVPEMRQNNAQFVQTDSGLGESVVTAGGEERPTGGYINQRTFTPNFHNFVAVCVHGNPKKRPSASVLIQHGFFRQTKRKTDSKTLPELLRPVTPLNDFSSLPKDRPTVEHVLQDLAEIELERIRWDF